MATARPHEYNVYVIEETVHGKKKFYVGQSGKSPEARLGDHRASCKRYCNTCKCRRYMPRADSGKGGHAMKLRYDLFSRYNPMDSRREAEAVERWLAVRLKKQGYDVIGGH